MLIEQGKIHAPGIYANALQTLVELRGGDPDTCFYLRPQPKNIPLQPIREPNRSIAKAVCFGKTQLSVFNSTDDSTPTFCTEVKSQVVASFTHHQSRWKYSSNSTNVASGRALASTKEDMNSCQRVLTSFAAIFACAVARSVSV